MQPAPLHDTIPVPGDTVLKVDTVLPPPVHIALTLAPLPDGSHRVIASSRDGRIIDSLSIDVPVGARASPERVLRWSAGVLNGVGGSGWGVYIARDAGPMHLLAGGMQGPTGG